MEVKHPFPRSNRGFHVMKQVLITFVCCVALTACTNEPQSKIIETPESWQSHLKTVAVDSLPVAVIEESVYVPIYSHIYVEDKDRSALLACTLSVRNTDPSGSIVLTSAKYYSTDGKMLQEFIPTPVQLGPMATADFVVSRPNESGGSGANFVVTWRASTKVSEPLLESVMIGTGSSQSFGFTSRGVVISRHSKSEIQKLPKASGSEVSEPKSSSTPAAAPASKPGAVQPPTKPAPSNPASTPAPVKPSKQSDLPPKAPAIAPQSMPPVAPSR